MKKEQNKNNKAFSLVELLATITILGILSTVAIISVSKLIQKAKDNHYKTQRENMVLAAQSYLNDNRNKLPKNIGQSSKIKLSELQDKNYIKEVLDYNKKDCDKDKSYVKVFKYSKTKYSYVGYLNCPKSGFETPPNSPELNGPKITVSIDQTTQEITLKIEDPNKVVSYSYIISKEFQTGDNKKYIEIINSGTKATSLKNTITDAVKISKHTPGRFKIDVKATDLYGNLSTKTEIKFVNDIIKPRCGETEGESTVWKTGEREITIKCSDEESGCKQDSYTQNFTGDVEVGTITIEDKKGNKNECPVDVYIDNTAPTIVELTNPKEATWTNKSFRVKIKAEDKVYKEGAGIKGSGIAGYKYYYDSDPNKVAYNLETCRTGSTSEICEYNDDLTNFTTTAFKLERNEYAYIEVCDKVGNCSNKKTKVQIDKTPPTLTIKAYKSLPKQTGPTGGVIQEVSVNNSLGVMMSYANTVNGWLNKANYPDGVYYETTLTEEETGSGLKEKLWEWNNINLTQEDNAGKDIEDILQNEKREAITGFSTSSVFSLSGEGFRMGRYTLTDQAGNIAQVIINAPIDITAPTLTVTAYQSDSAQKAPVGSSVGAITANKDSPDVTLSTYKNAVNGWLNKTNYPYGVYYQIAFSDNLGLKERIWQWNDVGKTSSNVGNEYDSATSPTTGVAITGKNGTHAVSLAGEGYRKGLYKVTDQAGNTATVKVNAPIDRTAPTNTTSTVRYIEATGTLGAIRSGSDQTVSTRRLWWGDFKATEAISGISHHEYSSDCTGPASRLYPPYNYPQNDAKTQNWSFCIRTVDNAGNAGAWSSKYYFNIKLP